MPSLKSFEKKQQWIHDQVEKYQKLLGDAVNDLRNDEKRVEANAYKLHAARLLAAELDERAALQEKVEEEEAQLKLQQAAIEEAIKEKKEMLKKQKMQFSSTTKNITFTPAIGDLPQGVKRKVVDITEDNSDNQDPQKRPKVTDPDSDDV